MQHNVKNYLEEDNNQRFDGRNNSLNTPTHGNVPRWLTDMSSHVERNHSEILKQDQIARNLERNNNEILMANRHFSFMDAQTQNGSTNTSANTSASTSRSNSARFGRRSSQSQYENMKKKNAQLDWDSYIVPKMEDINFSNFVHLNHYGFKPLHPEKNTQSTSSNLKSFVDKDEATSASTTESYSPSLLNEEKTGSGRRSRLNQIDSRLNDLSLNDRQHVADFIPVHFKSNSNPESNAYFHKKDAAYLMTTSNTSHNSLDVNLLQGQLNKSSKVFHAEKDFQNTDNLKTNFEDDFLMVKNKLQQRRKRYKSYKKSKSKFVVRHDNTFTDIPSSYLNNTTSNAPNMGPDQVFIIPELPAGTIMILDILSTWGDKFYVGLNGIELFDSEGNIVPVRKITACPEDINILPYCQGDPRVVTNLLDGVNRTQDDMHLWLTPFDAGEHHLIILEFFKRTVLGMIRIWNYNKSRIHSFRGAKDLVITLDGICIFRGEIAQACGSILGGIQSFGDTILFTTEEHILEKIAINDIAFSTLVADIDKQTPEKIERPLTATGAQESQQQRPYTHAYTNKNSDSEASEQLFGVQRLDIILILNWSKSDYIGLTGLEVIGDSDQAIKISKENLRCNDLTASAMLQRLIDCENITVDRKHMWYTQYIPDEEIIISILFEKLTYIAGIRFWNYNENLEMSFCGVRMIKIYMDSKPAINPLTNDCTFLLRRAPGNTHYDYVQEIKLSSSNLIDVHHEPFYELNHSAVTPKEELFENPIMPEGYVFQIVIYTTWGDQYYAGLNGLEIFDQHGNRIILTENNICAHPESVNVLPGVFGDVRTPDKLIDGVNERSDGSHSWLVPVIPKCLNRIYIVFDQPMTISVMKIWNYLKTPTRGVKEFGILVDDLLIYNGILDKINDKSSVKYRTILFTNNKNVLQKEMASLVKHSIDSQATILTNDEPRVTTGGSLPNADQSLRPFTSVNYLNRERTSQSN